MKKVIKHSSVVGVQVRMKNLLYIAVKGDDLADRSISQSFIYQWYDGELYDFPNSNQEWDVVGCCLSLSPKEQGMFLGQQGSCFFVGSGEEVDKNYE